MFTASSLRMSIGTESGSSIVATSRGILKIFSGLSSATSSMFMPPQGLATMTGLLVARSRRMATYISLATLKRLATRTELHGFPSSPVCFVMRRAPIIRSARPWTSPVLQRCTPPWKPLSKDPFPRPPARTCALITTSSTCNALATSAASAGELATLPSGTDTPNFRRRSWLWYSWMLSCRLKVCGTTNRLACTIRPHPTRAPNAIAIPLPRHPLTSSSPTFPTYLSLPS
mmetsp:Transcript_9824/g.27595  ORF Transcript_9824/g.27595 Transcript_9824/m.27595 type:complete len:230 (-) Transcript_9824:35-724(-)